MKSTSGLTSQMNTYISYTIQQIHPIHLQLKQDMPIPGQDNNVLDNFRPHKNEDFTLEKQIIEEDNKDLVGKIWILEVV